MKHEEFWNWNFDKKANHLGRKCHQTKSKCESNVWKESSRIRKRLTKTIGWWNFEASSCNVSMPVEWEKFVVQLLARRFWINFNRCNFAIVSISMLCNYYWCLISDGCLSACWYLIGNCAMKVRISIAKKRKKQQTLSQNRRFTKNNNW